MRTNVEIVKEKDFKVIHLVQDIIGFNFVKRNEITLNIDDMIRLHKEVEKFLIEIGVLDKTIIKLK